MTFYNLHRTSLCGQFFRCNFPVSSEMNSKKRSFAFRTGQCFIIVVENICVDICKTKSVHQTISHIIPEQWFPIYLMVAPFEPNHFSRQGFTIRGARHTQTKRTPIYPCPSRKKWSREVAVCTRKVVLATSSATFFILGQLEVVISNKLEVDRRNAWANIIAFSCIPFFYLTVSNL